MQRIVDKPLTQHASVSVFLHTYVKTIISNTNKNIVETFGQVVNETIVLPKDGPRVESPRPLKFLSIVALRDQRMNHNNNTVKHIIGNTNKNIVETFGKVVDETIVLPEDGPRVESPRPL